MASLHVRHMGRRLGLALGTRHETQLEHYQYDTFRASWPALGVRPHFVSFTLDARGRVAGLVIDAEGDIAFKRLLATGT